MVVNLVGTALDVADALRDEPHYGTSDKATLAWLEAGDLSPEQVSRVEARFWPLKLTDALLPTYLVPIKPAYAEQLFDAGLAEQTLFPRIMRLGVSREHVYYRSPRPGRPRAPARLVWYVSGEKGRHGVQAVRAVSRLEEAVVDKPQRLYRRFEHLGVYELADVQLKARRGLAMALRFADTERLPSPIPLARLRQHARTHGHTLMLRSINELPPAMFADLYREATDAERQP